MDCDRCKTNLIDAALGTLEGRRDAEFRAHLASCPPCRAALDTQRQLLAAIDCGIAESAAAEPSPEFVARVRRRLEQEMIRVRPWFAGWMPAAVGALAALALVAVWMARRATPGPGTHQPFQTTVATERPAPNTGTPRPQRTAAQPLVAQARDEGAGRRGLTTVKLGSRRGATSAAGPEVLVGPEERAAVLRFYDAVRSGRVDAASLLAAPAPLGPTELKIAPLDIAAIDMEWKEPLSDRAR
jgi:hypothetical protein